MTAKVFISYSSEDQKVARTICSALEKRGLPCWIASCDVGPGEISWKRSSGRSGQPR